MDRCTDASRGRSDQNALDNQHCFLVGRCWFGSVGLEQEEKAMKGKSEMRLLGVLAILGLTGLAIWFVNKQGAAKSSPFGPTGWTGQ